MSNFTMFVNLLNVVQEYNNEYQKLRYTIVNY